MSALLAKRRWRNEAPTVPEPFKPDVFVQKVKSIRDHRLQKAETVVLQARSACAASHAAMTRFRGKVAQARADADRHWQEAMADFQGMVINAKEFVARKSRHQQLKLQVEVIRSEVRDAVDNARADRKQLRQAQRALKEQQVQVEKLRLLKDLQRAESAQTAA